MTEFGLILMVRISFFLSALVRKAVEIPVGNLPSLAKPEIGLNGGGSSSRSPEWVSRQNTLVSAPLLHHHTLNLICGKRSSSFDLSTIHRDTKKNTETLFFYTHIHTFRHTGENGSHTHVYTLK